MSEFSKLLWTPLVPILVNWSPSYPKNPVLTKYWWPCFKLLWTPLVPILVSRSPSYPQNPVLTVTEASISHYGTRHFCDYTMRTGRRLLESSHVDSDKMSHIVMGWVFKFQDDGSNWCNWVKQENPPLPHQIGKNTGVQIRYITSFLQMYLLIWIK